MKILISGKPRSGKTTLIKKLAQQLKELAAGFYTDEVIENGMRVGFEIFDIGGKPLGILAHKDIESAFQVGRYKVNVDGFERAIEPVLRQSMAGKSPIILIDEIGKMELFSGVFRQLVTEILGSKKTVIATVKQGWQDSWAKQSHDSNVVKKVIRYENAEQIFKEICQTIKP